MPQHQDVQDFLSPFSPHIQELTHSLRDFIKSLVPEANELIWDNYNALAFAYSKSEQLKDAFCHLAVYSKHVNFGFNRGAELTSTNLELKGNGKLIRHIQVTALADFPKALIQPLLFEALGISEVNNPLLQDKQSVGKSIVMSVSEKKRRPKQ
ncbi:MAG: DUF1801 domain-containing protein [Saprospiraceae bacterium]|nr:DUF1801 domain-containing protein [Saprospiraceae bacterium]